jgi:hypothetical protein
MGTTMDTALAYLISVGIIGFGVWDAVAAEAGSDVFLIRIALGLLTIAVGLISLPGEIHDRRAAKSW